jgi:hypothetical protein
MVLLGPFAVRGGLVGEKERHSDRSADGPYGGFLAGGRGFVRCRFRNGLISFCGLD